MRTASASVRGRLARHRYGAAPIAALPGVGDVPGPAGALSVTFAWSLPEFNADGSPLSTPVSQRVEYSTASKGPDEAYEYVKTVPNGIATSVTINGLAAGTYYAAVRIFDGTNWSELSPEIFPGSVAA